MIWAEIKPKVKNVDVFASCFVDTFAWLVFGEGVKGWDGIG